VINDQGQESRPAAFQKPVATQKGTARQLADECRTERALYQGTASAGPQMLANKNPGFSPCGLYRLQHRNVRLYSLLKNSAFRPSEGGGFSLPNKAPPLNLALATGLSFDIRNGFFLQAA
jgi:hypothetical protein